jgi:MFS transporter, DHA3 family, macrolide efflux protein
MIARRFFIMSNYVDSGKDWRKTFFIIWSGQAFSIIGSMIVQFALVWYLTSQTGSAVVLSTATFASLLPQIILAPFAGALVDRWNRKAVMIIADGCIALTTLGLVVLFGTGHIQIWHIYVAGFIRSLGGAFHFPAMAASTALMVPDKHLSRINGINQALSGGLNIIAPPLGALLIGVLQMHWVLAIDIITAVIAIIPLALTVIPQPVLKEIVAVTPRTVLRDVGEGFAYVARYSGLLILLSMATFINFLFNPAFSLMPLLVTRVFKGGAMQLGFLESALGIGIIIGGVGLGIWGGFKKKVYPSSLGLVGMGIGTLGIALAPANMFWVAVIGLGFMGMMNPITNGPLHALLQSKVRPEMQGRVFTLVSSLASAMSPLGLIAAAPVADKLGIQVWYLLAGIATILMGGLVFTIRPVAQLEEVLGSELGQSPKSETVALPVAGQD